MIPTLLAAELFSCFEEYQIHHLRPWNCRHGEVIQELQYLVERSGKILKLHSLGNSVEGRSITHVSCGTGKISILLWSQMHGDEPTATLALIDIFHFLSQATGKDPWVRELLSECTVHAIPMLNPDGAEHAQRYTAVQIDMNRDARVLATPEAKILRNAYKRLVPVFGFNLHDQSLSSVGETGNVAALSFLAPPSDQARTMPLSRVRAMRLAALMVRSLSEFAGGHLSSYDDTFEPRAFGDLMQSWGTSTVLIESGHWPHDPEKNVIRKLNFVAILCALRAIGNNSYQDTELDYYTSLPKNGKRIYHYIIHNLLLESPGGWSHRVDVGLELDPAKNQWQPDGHPSPPVVTVKEIGDLREFGALETIPAHGRKISATSLQLEDTIPLSRILDLLQLYHET
jgi:hypothetical protein